MSATEYDLIVVGAGPNGLACAIDAIKNNITVLVIEKGTIAESIRRYPKQMTFFSTADNIGIGNIPFTIDRPKASREEALNYYRKVVEYFNIPLKLYSNVESISKTGKNFTVIAAGISYKSKYVILSTGYFDFPRELNIPGENLPHVKKYYDEPYPYAHQKVIIIGAGNSAVESALDLFRHGADVTLVVRGETMKKTAKYWLIPDLENRIKQGSIKAFFKHEAVEITPNQVKVKNNISGETTQIPGNFVFILAGYLPDTNFLKRTGIAVDEELAPIYNENTFETNIENLYVAGTLTAGIRTEKVFIENGRLHGAHIIRDILKKQS